MPRQRNWSSAKRAEQFRRELAVSWLYCHQNVRKTVNYAEDGAGYSVGVVSLPEGVNSECVCVRVRARVCVCVCDRDIVRA